MKKTTITAVIVAALTLTLTATAAFADVNWPAPGTSATISLAPVAMKSHRGGEFEKGYRFAIGEEVPFNVDGLAGYTDLSYMSADRAGERGDIGITTLATGVKAHCSTGVLSPYAQVGLGIAYVDQNGELGGNDWRPSYTVGAGIVSALGAYRIDLGWQFDTVKPTGGTLGAHTFAITTHIPLW